MPSLRSCSVGPPPSAIHGRGRLTRHPCRVAHCAEPALGLTRGAYTATASKAAYRPAWLLSSFVCEVHVDWPAAIASKLAPTGTQYISKISVSLQAVFASRLAPTVELGTFERNWSAVRTPSLASQLPQFDRVHL